jgi:hypothetical protein
LLQHKTDVKEEDIVRRWLLLTIGFLTLIALAACTTAETPEPTATSVSSTATAVEPTATTAPPSPTPTTPAEPSPTPTPSEESEAPDLQADALAGLNSYRAQITWQMDMAESAGQDMTINIAETRDPEARQITVSGMDVDIQVISTPEGDWVNVGGQWQSVPGGNLETFFGEMTLVTSEDINTLAAASQEDDYTFVGTETINGVQTRHYRIDVDSDEWGDIAGTTDVSTTQGDVWVADESDLPSFAVRFTVESEVEIEGEMGTATLTWDVQEINTDFTIEPPEEM